MKKLTALFALLAVLLTATPALHAQDKMIMKKDGVMMKDGKMMMMKKGKTMMMDDNGRMMDDKMMNK